MLKLDKPYTIKVLINFFVCLFVALLVHAELMLLGFISLLLTVGQVPISSVCISQRIGATWHPCSKKQEEALNQEHQTSSTNGRRLLNVSASGEGFHRILAGAASSTDKCAARVRVFIFHLLSLLVPYRKNRQCIAIFKYFVLLCAF